KTAYDVHSGLEFRLVLFRSERNAEHVRLLERVAAHHGARHLPRDREDGRAVHVRGGESGDEVRGTGARGRDAHADTASRAGVAVDRKSVVWGRRGGEGGVRG